MMPFGYFFINSPNFDNLLGFSVFFPCFSVFMGDSVFFAITYSFFYCTLTIIIKYKQKLCERQALKLRESERIYCIIELSNNYCVFDSNKKIFNFLLRDYPVVIYNNIVQRKNCTKTV